MKKTILVFSLILLCFTVVACGTKAENTQENNTQVAENETNGKSESNSANNSSTSDVDKDKELVEKEYSVKLYFPTTKYVVDGNDEEKMGAEEVKIFGTTDNIAQKVVEKLLQGPTDSALQNGVSKDLEIVTVEQKDGIVYINFSDKNLSGSSLQEEITINQVVETLIGIEGINGVKFLINGQNADTLFGHYNTSEVLTKGV